MSGPWYECQGPNAKKVREDVLNHINIVNKNKSNSEKDEIIKNALLKIIPDNRNDFGSWRGYATFGVKAEIAKEVIKEIQRNYALLTIKKKFTPYVLHYLYKPNGIRMKQLAETTLVGKNSAIV
jgi:hypothetical protein